MTSTARRISKTRPDSVNADWERIAALATAAGIPADDLLAIQTLPKSLLIFAATGRVDLNALASAELTSRGLDQVGKWIGFDRPAYLRKFAAAFG